MFFWSLELGGVEHMMAELSRELASRGHAVTLVLARPPQPKEYAADSRVPIVRLNASNTGKAILRLASHLRREHYDVLYTAMPTTNVATIAALRLSAVKTRLVISERSNPALEAQHSKTWRYRAAFTLQPFLIPWPTPSSPSARIWPMISPNSPGCPVRPSASSIIPHSTTGRLCPRQLAHTPGLTTKTLLWWSLLVG